MGLDLLGGEDSTHRRKHRIAIQQLQISRQLLNSVYLPAPLDLHGHGLTLGVSTHDVDRTDRGRELPSDEGPTLAQSLDAIGQQGLQVGLHPILDQTRIEAQIVHGIVMDLQQGDDQGLPRLVLHLPTPGVLIGDLDQGTRGAHPVERLIGAPVRVDEDGSIRLDHDDPHGLGEMGGQSARVVDHAPSHHDPHAEEPSRRALSLCAPHRGCAP